MACLIIAVDGTAASGKGTLARGLATHFGFAHLDTGLIYRKTAYLITQNGIDISNVEKIVDFIHSYDVTADIPTSLHTDEISSAASLIATHIEVRKALYKVQRSFADNKKGAVIDGRDIGTVIFPEAEIKLFITASLEVRTQRRLQQLKTEGKKVEFDKIMTNLQNRDKRDIERKVSPTVPAIDAIVIDNSQLNPVETLDFAILLCKNSIAKNQEAA